MPDAPNLFTGAPQLKEWQRQLIGMIPYVGPVYSAGRGVNAIVQYINSLGNHGGSYTPYSASPTLGTIDPSNDPNNPAAYQLGDKGATTSSTGGNSGYYMPGLAGLWNSNRAAFSPTYQQAMTPGSAIGPLSAMSNPYTGGTLGKNNLVGTGLSGPAAAYFNYIRSGNKQ